MKEGRHKEKEEMRCVCSKENNPGTTSPINRSPSEFIDCIPGTHIFPSSYVSEMIPSGEAAMASEMDWP